MINFKLWKYISLVFLCSCVSMSQQEQRQNLLSVPNLEQGLSESLDSTFFALGDWPQEKWWEIFEKQQLNHFIEEALKNNPDLQAVRSKIDVAKQEAKIIRSKLFPLIYFNAEDNWELLSHHGLYRALNEDIPINATLIDLTLSFNYEFDFWGKNRHLYKSAVGEARSKEAESKEIELVTTTAVAIAYFALKTNLIRKKLYEELYEVRYNTAALQKHLQEHALFSVLPPLFTEEGVLEADQFLQNIREEIKVNQHLLNILMGRSPDSPLSMDEELPSLPKKLTIPDTLSVDLLARRPDLMMQIWKVEAIANEVGAAKADFYPNINLGAFLGLESVAYSLLFKSSSKTMGLQPALHLPIFTAGAIKANVRAKKALFDEAVYHYNSLILRSVKEVADLLAFAESIFSQKRDQRKIVDKAVDRLFITMLREKSGLDSAFSRYALQEELIERQLKDITLLYQQYLAVVKLIKALGGGYRSESGIPIQKVESNG